MENLKMVLRGIVISAPLIAIITLSLLPLQIITRQSLIMFTLIWLNIYLLFNLLGRY